jgi:hypothetical protein
MPSMLLEIVRQFQRDPHAVNVNVGTNGGPEWESSQRPSSNVQANFAFEQFDAFEQWYAQPATRQALNSLFTQARQYSTQLSVDKSDPSAPSTPVPIIIRGN